MAILLEAGFEQIDDPQDQCACCDMTFKTRYICTAICSGLAAFFSFGAFAMLLQGDVNFFAVLYTIGIITALTGSFFMAGFKKHIQRLRESGVHAIAAIGVIVGMALVLLAGLALKGTGGKVLAIIALILQLGALAIFYLTMSELLWTAVKTLCRCVVG
jgi:hypothetical protein